jgi:hypothetical protein
MLELHTHDDETDFNPGDDVRVRLTWDLTAQPESVALSLTWHTEGKGDRDSSVVETVELSDVQQKQSVDLSITLPDGPYSFSGQLISLIWALEAVAHPSGASARRDIVLAPGKKEVTLGKVEDE